MVPMEQKPELGSETRRPRDLAMDGLRTVAVLLMIASHTSRLIVWDARPAWCRFALLIEPLTASLFLILVGASLVHSWHAVGLVQRMLWYRKQALRALALWCISCLFYTLEEGFHWPDALLASGILATIAYSILLGMLLVSQRRSVLLLLLLSAALAGLEFRLDALHAQWFLINAGNSPLLPLFQFVCLGALGVLAVRSPHRWVRAAVVTCAVLVLALILSRHTFTDVFSKPLGRYETARTVVTGTGPARIEKSIPYYNLRPILVPVIASLITLLYAILAAFSPLLKRFGYFVFPMGRHSLDVYILHLALLAILVLKGGMRPLPTAHWGNLALLTVIGISYAWALGRDAFRHQQSTSTVQTSS